MIRLKHTKFHGKSVCAKDQGNVGYQTTHRQRGYPLPQLPLPFKIYMQFTSFSLSTPCHSYFSVASPFHGALYSGMNSTTQTFDGFIYGRSLCSHSHSSQIRYKYSSQYRIIDAISTQNPFLISSSREYFMQMLMLVHKAIDIVGAQLNVISKYTSSVWFVSVRSFIRSFVRSFVCSFRLFIPCRVARTFATQ